MPVLPVITVGSRVAAIRDRLADEELAAVVVSGASNVRWCSGFTGSNALVVVTAETATFLTDRRYEEQAPVELAAVGADFDVVINRDLVAAAVPGIPEGPIGVDPATVTWAEARRWATELGRELTAAPAIVGQLRECKDEGEIARIAAAAAIVDEVIVECEPLLRTGVTERELGIALDDGIRSRGSSPAYETIVAGGPNGALPHARPGDREFASGDLVVVDVGATVDGYRSDMTRSFCIGEPSDQAREIHDLVRAAQAAGVAAVEAGAETGSVDRACREPIATGGYGAEFSHGTGHGVGLDIHEAPSVSAGNAAILQPGHVITVEPGIYVPGVGGVRIEDTVLVTPDGCRPLTSAPKRPL